MPLALTSFIGRAEELRELARLLEAARSPHDPACPPPRLLTITGPAGIGKTRLALQVAGLEHDRFASGACLVPLASIEDPALVLPALAQQLGLKEGGARPLVDRLRRWLQPRQILLVLDNFEQVMPAAPLLAHLLQGCPRLVLLVTSREVLRLPGEQEYRLRALPLPDPAAVHVPDVLANYASVSLFCERAAAVRPGFTLTAENAAGVARICVELEGIPLAIELAAARVKLLAPAQIASRLHDRFALLARSGRGSGPTRHDTLRAALDWSYRLLSAAEQALLRRLAVFAGGFTLEAAEAVAVFTNEQPIALASAHPPAEGELTKPLVLDLLSQLVDKSLVQVVDGGDHHSETRYMMLETIRDYAAECLDQAGETETARRRHAAYFVHLAEQAEPELRGPNQMAWIRGLESEQPNLWAAAMWSRSHEPEGQAALRLAGALAWFWRMFRGSPSEWRGWCEDLLNTRSRDRTPVRAKALFGVGTVALLQGDYPSARAMAEESLGLWQDFEDPLNLAHALSLLALVTHAQGLNAEANTLWERSLAIRRRHADQWGLAQALNNLGSLAEERGDTEAAIALYTESLVLARAVGDRRLIGLVLIGLASMSAQRGDQAAAGRFYSESTAIAAAMGDKWLAPQSLDGLADLAARAGDNPIAQSSLARAARLWGAAEGLREAIGSAIWPGQRHGYEAQVAAAEACLGEAAFAAAWAQGRAMSLDEAAAYAVTGNDGESPATAQSSIAERGTGQARPGGLTLRECEVASLVAQGKSNRLIAEDLVVTERTVTTHVGNILNKLGFSSRTQIATWAVANGLVAPPDRST